MKRAEVYLVNFGKKYNSDFGGDLRVQVQKRDKLEQVSELCINELCTLDMSRIYLDNLLTVLNDEELQEVELKLKTHLSL